MSTSSQAANHLILSAFLGTELNQRSISPFAVHGCRQNPEALLMKLPLLDHPAELLVGSSSSTMKQN